MTDTSRRSFLRGDGTTALEASVLPFLKVLPASAAGSDVIAAVTGHTINSLDIHRTGTNRPSYQVAEARYHSCIFELSGGMRQCIVIAIALACDPKLPITDEPTTGLDVSIQAVVLNLLVDLRAKLGISYLFVSHDLHVVRLPCDHVVAMKEGEIVEQGPTAQVMDAPAHAYTHTPLSAAPSPPIWATSAFSAA